MASSKVVSRLKPLAFKLNKKTPLSPLLSPLKSTPQCPMRVSRVPRLPLELSSVGTMIPLHSAIASARLISSLSIESRSWALVPQGVSMPL